MLGLSCVFVLQGWEDGDGGGMQGWAGEAGCVLGLGSMFIFSRSATSLTERRVQEAQTPDTTLIESRLAISRAGIFLPLRQRNSFREVD